MRRGTLNVLILIILSSFSWYGAAAQEGVRYEGHRVVRALPVNRAQVERILEITPDLWSHGIAIGRTVDFRVPPESWDEWMKSKVGFEVLIEDVQAMIDEQNRRPINPNGGWFADYKSLDEVNDYLDTLAAVNPDIAQVVTIGTSLEGRSIRGLRITNAEAGAPAFVMQGCQHAREWITPMVNMYVADHLVRNYGSDAEVTRLVDALDWFVIPIVNVDGYHYTRPEGGDERMWRKNRRDNGNGTFGVDLNRNWSAGFGGEGSSGNSGSDIYRGPFAFSEPESAAVADFVSSLSTPGVFLDIHSYSQLILAPWGYTSNLPSDHGMFQYLGAGMQERIFDVHGKAYEHGPTYTTIYPASGIASDWGYDEAGAISFGFELRDTGQYGFILPPDQIVPNGEEFLPAMLFLADFVDSNGLWFELPENVPARIDPNTVTPVRVRAVGVGGRTVDPDSLTVHSRIGESGSFDASPMSDLGDGLFEGLLPAAPCDSIVQFYFEGSSASGHTATLPADAPTTTFSTVAIESTVFFADDFESDLGWTVENIDVSDGAWERGVPAGGGDRGDPVSDFDGSGACFLTDNQAGNSDVDGGPTQLISPTIDLTGRIGATVSFACWFYNDDEDADRLDVHVSNDNGGNWTLVESIGNTGGWATHAFVVSDFIAPSSQVKVRFSATDNPNDSVTEAAIDAFAVLEEGCPGTELNDLQMVIGTLQSGGLPELANSDDAYVHTKSGFGATLVDLHNMEVVISAATDKTSPTTINLTLESRISHSSGSARIGLHNWGTDVFDQVGTFSLGNSDQLDQITGVAASNYVNANGEIELSIKHLVFVPFLAFQFDSWLDLVEIEVQ